MLIPVLPSIYRIFLSDGKRTAKISAAKDGINVIVRFLPDVLRVVHIDAGHRGRGVSQHGGHQVDILSFRKEEGGKGVPEGMNVHAWFKAGNGFIDFVVAVCNSRENPPVY